MKDFKEILKKQHYALVGKHSAVQICRWTKKSLLNEGCCYKEKFYGISSHRCCQMSPFLACPNECIHCWRPIEIEMLGLTPSEKEVDTPEKIIEECILSQRKMLTGFKGNRKIDMKKWKEAQNPSQFAISLIGEPTLYPKLAELILELRKQGKTSFLVTNGLYPEKLRELAKKNALPTQIYLSLNTPNKKMYDNWHKSKLNDAWERFNETLSIFSDLPTRKVVRMTLVKDMNMGNEEEYAELIKKTDGDFIECKGYMSVGYARKRLGYEKMPDYQEIKDFAARLLKFLPEYKLLDEKEESNVVLIGKDKERMKINDNEI